MFEKRLQKDWYAQQVPLEAGKDTRWLNELLCSICHEFHSRDAFTPHARAQCAETRACISISRCFRACPHKWLSYREVQDIKRRCLEGCHDDTKHVDDTSCIYFCDDIDCGGALRKYRGQYFVVNRMVFLCHILEIRKQVVPVSAIQRALQRLDMYVCPHVRTSSTELFDRLDAMWPVALKTLRKERKANVECPGEDCDSTIVLHLDRETEMPFHVCKGLGRLVEPLNKGWVAQLEGLDNVGVQDVS
jgi:hypothetical protein